MEKGFSAPLLGQWSRKTLTVFLLKVSLAFVLIWFLVEYDIIEFRHLNALLDHFGYAALAATVFLATIAVAAYRWQLLLAAQDIHLPLTTATKIVAAANATSIILAGFIGGEALRAAWILGALRSRRTEALLSLPLDRALGLLGLLAIASTAVALRWDLLVSELELAPLAVLTVSLFAAALAVVLVGHWSITRFRILDRFDDWEDTGQVKKYAWRLMNAIMVYRDRRVCLAACFLLSILTNALTVLAFLVLLNFMPEGGLGTVEVVFAFVLSTMANVLAITPGGIGIGEGAFEAICQLMGGSSTGVAYGTLFFMFRIVTWIPLAAILAAMYLGKWRLGDEPRIG